MFHCLISSVYEVSSRVDLQLRSYFGTTWNVFDFFVVFASVIEVILTLSDASSVGFLSVLRIFRLFRVLRLAQHWKTMGHLISTIGRSLGQVWLCGGMRLCDDPNSSPTDVGGESVFNNVDHYLPLCGDGHATVWRILSPGKVSRQ